MTVPYAENWDEKDFSASSVYLSRRPHLSQAEKAFLRLNDEGDGKPSAGEVFYPLATGKIPVDHMHTPSSKKMLEEKFNPAPTS